MKDFADKIWLMQNDDDDRAEDNAPNEQRFQYAEAHLPSFPPIQRGQAEKGDDGGSNPISQNAAVPAQEKISEKKRRAHAEKKK